MIELSGYVFSSLREGDIALYRGSGNGLTPILLVAAEETSPGCVERLEHEYALKSELDADWAARPVALTHDNGRMTLVLEDPGGTPLDRLLGRPLDVSHFLRIAIPLAGALRDVHERGLIHKDIKPANILVESASSGVWLTGFGIASRLPRERQAPAPPEVIAGTLAYMAPEQTGRMNRSIDSRSDLYALGVTFYQMLTGSLPFTAADPMEWVHCHIARKPVPPSERVTAVPTQVSAIVLKLLAKTAEDRYQTAVGLTFDLRRCLADWDSFGRVKSFPLGCQDASDRLLIPENLYGREREIDALVSAFDRVVAQGTPELVLVSGYSGIGKSSVVNELHKVLVPPRGLFASGKFDQYKRDIPYATLAQAFQKLIRRLLGQSEAELGQWRDALRDALGPNGQLVVNLIPEIELVIGKQPPVPELAPQDAQNRFQMVFRRLIGVFARPEHPLALFLDDLQWLDAATLDLLEHLITHSEVRHLLLVGAYRDNEVAPSHPLIRTLAAIHAAGALVHEVVLAPLGFDDVSRLLADALRCDLERAQPLARLVHEKTGGNPFFAIQFFTMLADEGLLAFDPLAPAWQWDIDRIRAKGYTENVVEFMVGKLSRLPDETQDALKLLACLGNVAEIATLTTVRGQSEHENPEQAMHTALWEAVRAGFVFRLESAYTFPHDRIQQAAYSLIPDAHRADMHLRIGRALLASMTADELDELLFDIANQLNWGAALLVDRDEKTRVAAINLRAARKAKASAAYASARVYLAEGMALLDETYWTSHYELTFSLWLECAECEFLTGELDRAEQLLAELLQRGVSKVDLAAVYELKVLLHIVKSENVQAIDSALACLKLFGIDIPAHPSWEQVQAEYETLWRSLEARPIEDLIDLPLMQDPELQAATRVLCALSNSAYVTDRNLFCFELCRTLNLSMRHGVNGASAHACGYLGFSLGPAFQRYPEGFRLAKLGCDLVEKHGFLAYRAKVQDATGIAAFWTHPLATAIDFVRACLRTSIESGDLTYACYGMAHIVMLLLLRNDPLDAVWRESEIALDFLHKSKFRDMEDILVPQRRFIAAMQGRTASLSTFNDAQFDEAAFEAQLTSDRMPTMICWYWIMKAKARFLSGDYAEALAAADKATALIWSSTAHFPLLDHYYYTALTMAALYENASADEQNGWRDRLAEHQEQLREWADSYPPTFADKHALVLAEIARLEGRDADAMRLYEQAIRSARDHGFVQNEGLAHEVAARFYTARGFETIANAYLRNARYCYLRWGAAGKVRQLDQLYPHLRKEEPGPGPTSTIGAPVEHLDLATVIKVSQAVSGEIVLEKLIDTLMRTAIEHAGAERGLLILPRGTELQIKAEATTSGDTVTVHLVDEAVTERVLPESVLHYVLRTRETAILDDAAAQSPFGADAYIHQRRARSILCLPLLNRANLIGVLYLENNLTPRVFAPARISVLKLLASQAAIALENARLYREVAEREKQQTAISEMLRIISNSPIQSVLDAVAENAARLCDANNAEIFRLEDNLLRLAASYGEIPVVIHAYQGVAVNRDTVTGRAACDRRTIHVHDLAAEEGEYPVGSSNAKREGHHATLGTPLLRKGGPIGVILVRRREMRPFSDEQIALIETFADQAVIAIENARLFEAEKERTLALAHANRDLAEREAKIRRLVEANIIGIIIWHFDGRIVEANDEFLRMVNYDREDLVSGRIRWTDLTPPDWQDLDSAKIEQQKISGRLEPFEKEYTRKDGRRVPVLIGVATFEEGGNEGVAFVLDLTERKRAEQALMRSEAYLAEAQKLTHTGSWVWNPRTEEVLYCSEEMFKIFGLDPQESSPSRENFRQQIHPEDRDRIKRKFEGALREKVDTVAEYRVLLRDGTIRHINASGHLVLDEEGELIEFLGTATDVTERKRAEHELRESETKFSDYAAAASDWLWEIGPDYKFTLLTENAFHSDAVDRIGTFCWDHALDLETEAEKWRLVRATLESRKQFHNFVYCAADGTGSAMYVKASGKPVFGANGEFRGYRGTGTDVTAIIRAEYLTQQMFETSADRLSIVGRDYRYQRANPAFGLRWGMSAGAIVGMHVADLLGVESFEQMAKPYLDRCFAGEEVSYTDWLATPLGRRYSAVTYSPLRPESQRVEAALVIIRDLTEHILASEALREAQMELAHVNRVNTMGQLTASITHEVNQPITAAVTYASAARRLLSAKPPDFHEVDDVLALIVKEGNRAGEVVARIRALIKKAPARKDAIAINDAILEVIALTRTEAANNGVLVRTQLAEGLPRIEGDRIQLQQVLLNLIINAIEAMRDAGEGDRELIICSRNEPDGVSVEVRDSGPGFAPAALERVFEAFYTTKPSGLGLGLSICRSIIEAHSGRLWASANPPRGASFQFALPVLANTAS